MDQESKQQPQSSPTAPLQQNLQPDIQPTNQPTMQPAVQQSQPNNTLAIIGLLLSIFFNLVGLIVSIVALMKSKKIGQKNTIALAGVIVGSITTFLTLLVLSVAILIASNQPLNPNSSPFSLLSQTTDIEGTEVTVSSGQVESTCFSFEMPKNFIISPLSKACASEIRLDNGTSTGVALTAITVTANLGDSSIADFEELMEKNGSTDVRRTTVQGYEAAVGTIDDGFTPKRAYFITDDSKRFTADGKIVTSYLISGPDALEDLDTVVNSFTLK